MSIVVDRVEGARAVLEICGERIEIPAASLPEGAVEGSTLTLALAPVSEVEAPRAEAEARLARLKRRTPAEDIIDL